MRSSYLFGIMYRTQDFNPDTHELFSQTPAPRIMDLYKYHGAVIPVRLAEEVAAFFPLLFATRIIVKLISKHRRRAHWEMRRVWLRYAGQR